MNRASLLTVKTTDRLKAKLQPLGVTLDVTDYTIHCDAPAGYVWRANGLPSLSIHYATNSQTWLVQAVNGECENLRMGLRKVTDPEELAEHQHNLDDDNWRAPADAPDTIIPIL